METCLVFVTLPCTFLTGLPQIFWLDKEQKQDVLWLISSSFMLLFFFFFSCCTFHHLNLSFILFYCLMLPSHLSHIVSYHLCGLSHPSNPPNFSTVPMEQHFPIWIFPFHIEPVHSASLLPCNFFPALIRHLGHI